MRFAPLRRALACLLLVMALVASPANASSSDVPYGLDGSYDPDTDEFTLTWQYSGASVEHFIVYIDGEAVETDDPITTTSYVDNLAEWKLNLPPTAMTISEAELNRHYQVAAVVGGVEQEPSEVFMIAQIRPPGGSCAIVGVNVYPDVASWLPIFTYAIYEQCVPPVPPL